MTFRRRQPWPLGIMLALLTAATAGCTAAPHTGEPHEQVALSLHAATEDGRVSFFEIDKDGQFAFGGGRDAVAFNTHPVGKLSDEHRREIWQLIQQHQLIDGRDRPFASSEKVTYHVQIRTGNRRRSYRAIDDEVPGLKALHDRLLAIQADMRYDQPGATSPSAEQTGP